jgi:hypothetical protein
MRWAGPFSPSFCGSDCFPQAMNDRSTSDPFDPTPPCVGPACPPGQSSGDGAARRDGKGTVASSGDSGGR